MRTRVGSVEPTCDGREEKKGVRIPGSKKKKGATT